ncbi:hypothetical protein SDC9_97035 [bioreactor metagenome]|uniref:Uncharacterized protein n=1 Tax=bioreactor metagenome TaxID=1076179 RepID=A0A645ABK5_9ZZZZ
MLVESHVREAQFIHLRAGVFVSEKRRIALNKGIEPLLVKKIRGDAFDLLRRTAVERREGYRAADSGRDGFDVAFVDVLEVFQIRERPAFALFPDIRFAGILQPFNKGVDLFGSDAFEIIADAHIEHESVRRAEGELPGDQLQDVPGFDIFVQRLRHAKLGGPFDVVTLVARVDARLGDRQVLAVKRLYRLQLKKTRTREIGGDDILGQLRMRPRRRTEGRFNLLIKKVQRRPFSPVRKTHAKDTLIVFHIRKDPIHQCPKGNGSHSVAHARNLLCYDCIDVNIKKIFRYRHFMLCKKNARLSLLFCASICST